MEKNPEVDCFASAVLTAVPGNGWCRRRQCSERGGRDELDGLGRRAHLLVLQGRFPRIAADLRIYRGKGTGSDGLPDDSKRPTRRCTDPLRRIGASKRQGAGHRLRLPHPRGMGLFSEVSATGKVGIARCFGTGGNGKRGQTAVMRNGYWRGELFEGWSRGAGSAEANPGIFG